MFAGDIGPGNCLIDEWIRKNSKYKYDKDGLIAKSGKVNELIFNQAIDNFLYKGEDKLRSFDIKDFDISFVRGLSLEDGAATLTEFTADIIITKMLMDIDKIDKPIDVYATTPKDNIYICGGGRKNQFLIERIKFCSLRSNTKHKINIIDDLGVDGDFIESQAFGYLAIRSYLGLPISFPETTGCIKPCTGGVIIKNY
jgi:anhydro-N-acetylmuramic acid kinase